MRDRPKIVLATAPAVLGVDWIDKNTRKTYDQVGNFPAAHFDDQWRRGALQKQINDHFNKADFVVIDVAQFTPVQTQAVLNFIDPQRHPRGAVQGLDATIPRHINPQNLGKVILVGM
jgi:hypothetical protein